MIVSHFLPAPPAYLTIGAFSGLEVNLTINGALVDPAGFGPNMFIEYNSTLNSYSSTPPVSVG